MDSSWVHACALLSHWQMHHTTAPGPSLVLGLVSCRYSTTPRGEQLLHEHNRMRCHPEPHDSSLLFKGVPHVTRQDETKSGAVLSVWRGAAQHPKKDVPGPIGTSTMAHAHASLFCKVLKWMEEEAQWTGQVSSAVRQEPLSGAQAGSVGQHQPRW